VLHLSANGWRKELTVLKRVKKSFVIEEKIAS
jgi:hypothetical protein